MSTKRTPSKPSKTKGKHPGNKQLANRGGQKSSDGPNLIRELNLIRAAFEELEGNYVKTLHTLIGRACQAATDLSRDKQQWASFCADPWWKSAQRKVKGSHTAIRPPKKDDSKEALRHVFKWIFGNRRDPVSTASFYYRAVTPLIEEGVSPKKIPAAIVARGGLKQLAKSGGESESSDSDGSATNKVAADEEGDRENKGKRLAKPKQARAANQSASDDKKAKPPRTQKHGDLAITLDTIMDGGDYGLFRLKFPAYLSLYGVFHGFEGDRAKMTIEGITIVEAPYRP